MKISQNLKSLFRIRQIIDSQNIYMMYDTFLINNENNPITESIFSEDTIFPSDFTVRPEIRKKRIRNTAQRFLPGLVAGNGVD